MSRFIEGYDYPITSVCKGDLEEYFTKEQIDSFTNEDMEYLARKMADAYCENGFWIDMQIIAKSILNEKEES